MLLMFHTKHAYYAHILCYSIPVHNVHLYQACVMYAKDNQTFFLFSCIDTVICMTVYSAVSVKYAAILLSIIGCLQ